MGAGSDLPAPRPGLAGSHGSLFSGQRLAPPATGEFCCPLPVQRASCLADLGRHDRGPAGSGEGRGAAMSFVLAQKVADAVLYEGYLLYPYRASAVKNQVRWQFGVVTPRAYSEDDGPEPWTMQTECLIDPGDAARLDCRIRFLQVQARTVERALETQSGVFQPVEILENEGQQLVPWDEGIERELDWLNIDLRAILATERLIPFALPGEREIELVHGATGTIKGRVVRECRPLSGVVRVAAEALGSLIKVRVRIENHSVWLPNSDLDHNRVVLWSLVGTHTLLAVRDGAFLSLLDPPEWAQ